MEVKELNIKEIPKDGIFKIYHGKAVDERLPKQLANISGAINTPHEFLTKRKGEDSLNLKQSHIEFDYENSIITLICNENSHESFKVIGKMIKTEVLKNLKINTGEKWSCFDLADFFRMNRTIFLDKDQAAKLVTLLNKFEAKVNKEIEQKKDNRANYNLHKRQVVESNLPDSFKLNLEIFKGQVKSIIDVEIDIDPASLDCVLISPELADKEKVLVESEIGSECDRIMELCEELPIIEV